MPVVFIHGVNTRRTDKRYAEDASSRERLLRRLVLRPLADAYPGLDRLAIVTAYWGDDGVAFRWNLASLPRVRVIESYGAGQGYDGELAFAATVAALGAPADPAPPAEELEDGILRRAAQRDLVVFLESAMSPLYLADLRLSADDEDAEVEGGLEALLAIAMHDVATDPATEVALADLTSDDELIYILRERVLERFDALRNDGTQAGEDAEIEGYGPKLDNAKDQVRELFDRARGAPLRSTSVPALALWRRHLHERPSRFMGDIFVYLKERGDAAAPGPIIRAVDTAIRSAPRSGPEEPLIVLTHSMGGNILYDLLTHYSTDLRLTLWVSVGGQVGQFEEMKLFHASDPNVGTPDKVAGLRERVGYWLNVYDPADPFGFMAAPVFEDVNADIAYSTGAGGMKAHSEYFGRPSFYKLVGEHLEAALQ